MSATTEHQLRAKNAALEKDNAKLQARNAELEERNAKLAREKEGLDKVVIKLRDRYDVLRSDLRKARSSITRLMKAFGKVQTKRNEGNVREAARLKVELDVMEVQVTEQVKLATQSAKDLKEKVSEFEGTALAHEFEYMDL